MENITLLRADYLDIIYNNRNKFYGGYELRRNYNSRLKRAGGFVALALAAIISFSFVKVEKEIEKPIVYVKPVDLSKIEPIVAVKPVAKIEPVAPPPKAKTIEYSIPKITPDHEVKPDEQLQPNDKLKTAVAGTANSDGDTILTDVGISGPTGNGKPGGPVVAAAAPYHTFVEQMPAFIGDMGAYLSSHLQYPAAARETGIGGRVLVQYVVNEDGSISNATVVRSIGGGCDEEALRVIKNMPKWKPGRQNGIAAKVLYTQPITFRLE